MDNGGAILYAEDEPNDVLFLQIAFQTLGIANLLRTVPDGEQAVDYLAGRGPYADRALHPLPSLVLLDINMPKKSGFEVLEWIRRQPRLKTLPVLMFTSSEHEGDMERARKLGANDYLLKLSNPGKLVELVKSLQKR